MNHQMSIFYVKLIVLSGFDLIFNDSFIIYYFFLVYTCLLQIIFNLQMSYRTSVVMQNQHTNRFQNILTNKRKVEFKNPRRRFDLDRIIQQYESDLKDSPKQSSEYMNAQRAVFSLDKPIKILPLRTDEPSKRYKRPIQLQSLEPQKSNQDLASHLKLKTLATRYKSNHQEQRVGARSIQLEPKSYRGNKLMQKSLRVRAKNKHSSLITLQQRKSDTSVRSKSKQDKGIRWGHRTRKGYNPNDPHKPNQDQYLIKIFKNNNRYLFAIADGHGSNGHLVSQFIIHRLQGHIAQQASENHILSLSRTYNKLQDELYKTNLFDVMLSGSTLLTAIINFPKLICANSGDSRAVLVRKLDKQNWEVVHVSEDHKPSLPKERKRILKKGGKIHSFKDEQGHSVGPLRVWLPSKDMPGLAMSRSLGDNLCKSIGVTHEPEVVELQIESEDKFIILGSDGVWQNVSTGQILNFLVPLYNQGRLQQCCDALLQLCLSSALKKPLDAIDDITFIIVFLNKP